MATPDDFGKLVGDRTHRPIQFGVMIFLMRERSGSKHLVYMVNNIEDSRSVRQNVEK